jgi:hypothetical protein
MTVVTSKEALLLLITWCVYGFVVILRIRSVGLCSPLTGLDAACWREKIKPSPEIMYRRFLWHKQLRKGWFNLTHSRALLKNASNLLARWATIKFSGTTSFHWVSCVQLLIHVTLNIKHSVRNVRRCVYHLYCTLTINYFFKGVPRAGYY